MEDQFNLKRFIVAQRTSYYGALEEIKIGRKSNHWMWYIFPQFKGLGWSSISKTYAINSKEEAICYYQHPVLGQRLKEITKEFLAIENKSAYQILGRPDDMKIKSSMTLFDAVQSETNLFALVLEKYFDGKRCERTLRLLNE